MEEITVPLCEAFKAIGIDISETDLWRFEKALYERGLNVALLTAYDYDIDRPRPGSRS